MFLSIHKGCWTLSTITVMKVEGVVGDICNCYYKDKTKSTYKRLIHG